MKKRGIIANKAQSNIIIIVLIILIILVLLVILWNIVMGLLKQSQYTTETQTRIMNVQIRIDNVDTDWRNPPLGTSYIRLSITRGSEPLVDAGTTTTLTSVPVPVDMDVVTVVDLSVSMSNPDMSGDCLMNTDITPVMCRPIGAKDCNNDPICRAYGGVFIGGVCKSCCNENNCGVQTICEGTCNGRFMDGECMNSIRCSPNQGFCTGSTGIYESFDYSICNGDWRVDSTKRIKVANESSFTFIDSVLNFNPNNRIGIVGFKETVAAGDIHPLSSDRTSLKTMINSRLTEANADGGTNLCSGIKKAIELLNNPSKTQVMVILTDGIPKSKCDGGPWPADKWIYDDAAIELKDTYAEHLACLNCPLNPGSNNLYEAKNISVYTISFGHVYDESLLRDLAENNNGHFYRASIDNLDAIYTQVASQMQQEVLQFYQAELQLDHLKTVVFGTNSAGNLDTCVQDRYGIIINPLETRPLEVYTCGFTNINKIEIYLVAKTQDGREVTKLLSSYSG